MSSKHHSESQSDNTANRITITAEEINALPLKAFEGKVHVITEPQKITALFKEIEKHEVVGFDTETRPSFKKGQVYKVALVQIAMDHKAYLIRTHHTGITDELASIFESQKIIKAGVAIHDDIKALQKFRKFDPGSFIDLSTVARKAGYQVESVKKLAALLLGFRISKSAQTSNWEAPTLTEKQLEYAATDAWVCLEIYKQLHKL